VANANGSMKVQEIVSLNSSFDPKKLVSHLDFRLKKLQEYGPANKLLN